MINKTIVGIVGIASALFMSGCTRDWKAQDVSMWNESRYKPYEQSSFFADNSTSRPISRGTVARGQLRTDEAFFKVIIVDTCDPYLLTPAWCVDELSIADINSDMVDLVL